jgi:hypothetical protein
MTNWTNSKNVPVVTEKLFIASDSITVYMLSCHTNIVLKCFPNHYCCVLVLALLILLTN